jgi:hypothetical protein
MTSTMMRSLATEQGAHCCWPWVSLGEAPCFHDTGARANSPGGRVSEPLQDQAASPAAARASAPLAAGAYGLLGSGAGASAELRCARRFPAPASTDLPAPALERTPRLQRRSPAMRQRPRALGRRPTEHVDSLCGCEGTVPAAQSPAHSGLACAFLARTVTNVGKRVPACLPEVRTGET